MKTEREVTEHLAELRTRLASVDRERKAKPRGGGGANIKNKRVLEGEIAALAWVLGVPDAGPTPTGW